MMVSMWRFVHRFQFTLLMEGLLLSASLVTGSYAAGGLSSAWLAHVGFAPTDLLTPDFWRIFTSAVVTSGLSWLLSAMISVAVIVGTGEAMVGSRCTAWTFWGVHVVALLIGSLFIALPLYHFGHPLGASLAFTGDIGPSAGYFGVLGLIIARLKKTWGRIAGVAILAWLIIMIWLSLAQEGSGDVISAALAHLIAFVLGWLAFSLPSLKWNHCAKRL